MKRVLSLVLALVLVLGMIPTFAADTASGAQNLYDNGFITGKDGATVDAKLDVNAKLTRAELAALIAELNGAKEEAAAFAQPADFTDAATFQDWAKPFIAYAQENTWINGFPDGSFGPDKEVSAQQLAAVLMNALGYTVDTPAKYASVLTDAATLGIVVDGTALTRGEAFEAMWTAVSAVNVNGEDMTLGVKLGKLEPATPEVPADFLVESVTTDNLIQAVVTFNQPVDADTASDKDNYDFATADKITVSNVTLSEDKTQATLTFAAKVEQQKTASLTVSAVKSAAGVTITKVTTPVSFLDSTIPTIVSSEVVGVSTIKVTFSEPMETVVASNFKVNDGKYYVKGVTGQKNNTEWLVELYTSLKTGDLPFEVKVGPKDYAGFTSIGSTSTLTVVEDTEAPYVVSYKDAKPNSVVLVWNEDIVLVAGALANYYHTNASNTIAANLTSAEIDGNEMTLNFADAHKLPNGTAYAYVLKEAVKDLWNNKNAQQMTKLDVVVDNTAPVLTSIVYKAENKIQLVFDEVVTKANVKANYTLLDKDGKEVSAIISSIDVTTAKKVMITFTKNLDAGNYTLVAKNVEDASGNAMAATTIGFTVTDKTAPVAADFSAKLYLVAGTVDQILKVNFGEAMATSGTYSIDDLAKYQLAGVGAIEDLTDATIAVTDAGKSVEITIPNTSAVVPTGVAKLTIARVADAADNYTAALTNTIDISASGNITITKAVLTGAKEVKVYFSDALAKFEATELVFSNGAAVGISSVTTDLVSGKTVATYTLTGAFAYNASNLAIVTANPAGANVTANSYGETLAKNVAPAAYQDKLKPAIAEISTDVDNVVSVDANNDGILESIKITYTEDLYDNFNQFSYSVEGHKVTGVTELAGVVTIALDVVNDDNGDALVPAWDQTPVVTQLLSVYDVALNELAATATAIDTVDKAAPVLKTVVLANGTGTAATLDVNDKITLTFSEAMKGDATSFTMTNGVVTVLGKTLTFGTPGVNAGSGTIAWNASKTVATLTFTVVTDATSVASGIVTPASTGILDAANNELANVATGAATGTF